MTTPQDHVRNVIVHVLCVLMGQMIVFRANQARYQTEEHA